MAIPETQSNPYQRLADGGGRAIDKLAYTIAEFCAATGLGRSSTYEEIAAGRLRAIKAGGRRLILKQDAEEWLYANRDAP